MNTPASICITVVTHNPECAKRIRQAFEYESDTALSFMRRPPARVERAYEPLETRADMVIVDLELSQTDPENFWADLRHWFGQAPVIAVIHTGAGAELVSNALACNVSAFVTTDNLQAGLRHWIYTVLGVAHTPALRSAWHTLQRLPLQPALPGRAAAGNGGAPGRELLINRQCFRAERDGQIFYLSGLEFALLDYLAGNRERVVPLEELTLNVWRCSPPGSSLTEQVRKCIWRLRQKIEADPRRPQFLINIRGHGYMLANARTL